MKILIINASPRKKGNTFLLSQILAEKLKSFGDVEIEHIFLSDLNIELCKGCGNCLIRGESYCPNASDDRVMLEDKILSANGVIFATPVYAMNMPALMKNFMDRFAFTMHRPRFFNQYTMIMAVTGVVGLKETIKSISQLKFCGYNIVQTFGLKAQNPLENVVITDTKIIREAEKNAEKFYKKIKSKKSIEPSLISLLSFHFQKKCFSSLDPKKYKDWQYFNEKGWFSPKCNYYVNNANLPLHKRLLLSLISML